MLIEDVTINRAQEIHLHIRFRGGQTRSLTIPIPPRAWEARQTDPDTLALLDRLLDKHTDAETAAELNHAARRSGTGKPFTAAIVLHIRRARNLPSQAERLQRVACSPSTRSPSNSACTSLTFLETASSLSSWRIRVFAPASSICPSVLNPGASPRSMRSCFSQP